MKQYIVVVKNLISEKYVLEADCPQKAVEKVDDLAPSESSVEDVSIEIATVNNG